MTWRRALIPPPLRAGSHVAIVSPSGVVDRDAVEGAAGVLSKWGYVPEIMPNVFARHGSLAGTDGQRLADMTAALTSPRYDAVMCSRGGYGAVRLLRALNSLPLRLSPRWLMGYSDITALHCLMGAHGIASIHSPNCRHLALHGGEDECSQRLRAILAGETLPPVVTPTHRLAVHGKASGTLRGGNFAVLSGLISTPFDPLAGHDDTILVLEDISEPVYKVERMLHTLLLSGALYRLKGIVFGQFTNYRSTMLFSEMEQMIAPIVKDLGIPVAMNFPVGHVDRNFPLILSHRATLTVDGGATVLTQPDAVTVH